MLGTETVADYSLGRILLLRLLVRCFSSGSAEEVVVALMVAAVGDVAVVLGGAVPLGSQLLELVLLAWLVAWQHVHADQAMEVLLADLQIAAVRIAAASDIMLTLVHFLICKGIE